MTSYIALEAPAWLWILSCFTLLIAGIAFGALMGAVLRKAVPMGNAWHEFGVARADDPPDTTRDASCLPALWPRDDDTTRTLVSS